MEALRTRVIGEIKGNLSDAALTARYDQLHSQSRPELLKNRVRVDRVIGLANPGISLQVHLGKYHRSEIEPVVEAQRKIAGVEPDLFAPEPQNLHMAVFLLNPSYSHDMEAASANQGIYTGPTIVKEEYYERYKLAVRRVLIGLSPFQVRFTGILATPQAIFAYGLDSGILNFLRLSLWKALDNEGLPFADRQPNIVHSTILRYRRPLNNPRRFVRMIEKLRRQNLGAITIHRITMIREIRSYMAFTPLEEFELGV